MSAGKSNPCTKVCCFCNLAEDNELNYGKFYEHDGIVTHYYCLLLSSNMEQKGNDDEGILGFLAADIQKELRRGKRLVCSYCKKIGATLGCCNVKCKRIFHFPCGQKAGSLHQFFGEFRSYCVNHRPKQNVDDYILKQVGSSDNMLCYICYDKVNYNDYLDTLWAPCCKKNAWFHRKCVQQLALSAGYFFKCPLCNNKKEFQKAMLEHGIFIPSQDASWELVPHAFEELLYRHDQCDAVTCLCPKGRKHTSTNAECYSKWELALCRTCGSQGIHMFCGQLKWANPLWECPDCTSILRKCHGNTTSSNSSDSSSQNRDSSDDSDSDISVGTDSPVPYLLPSHSSSSVPIESNAKLRPGPRSFKLRQQMKTDRMIKCTSQFAHTIPERNDTNKTNPSDVAEFISKDDNLKKKPKKDDLNQEENKDKKENNVQQTSKIDNSVKKKKSSNMDKPVPNEADVIVIDSDEDDIEFISLRQKENLSSIQTTPTNILSSNPVNVTRNSLPSIYEDTSTNKMLIDSLEIDNTNSQKSNASKSEVLDKEESIALEKSTKLTPQILIHDINLLKRDDVLEDANAADASVNSIMNIKITNVTSLPPEIFASVPEARNEEEIAWAPDVTVHTSKSLEKWFATHVPSPKSDVHEDGNPKRKLEYICLPLNEIPDNCKKLKEDSCNKTFTDKTKSTDSRDNIAHNTRRQHQIISEIESNNICEDTKGFSKSIVSTNELFKSPTINDQNNKLFTKSKADVDHMSVKPNHLEENSASIIAQHSNKNSQLANKPIIQSNNQFYVHIPPSNIFFAESMLNSSLKNGQDTRKTENAYTTTSSDVVLPQMINNTAIIDNRRTMFSNQPIAADMIGSISANNNDIGMLNKQGIGYTKKASSKNVSNSGHESSDKVVCDGDAGRTSPAVTRRPTCFSEFVENAKICEVLDTDSTNQKSDRSSKSRATVRKSLRRKIPGENDAIYISSAPYSSSIKNHNVFPQVTNNHSACHQPRLIPRYMHLQDLKFQVCGSDSVQMILYDMFSVNIPVKNATQEKRRFDVASRASKEPAINCRAQNETLSSLDLTDGTANHLDNSRTKCIADSTVIVAAHSHDDAKENLDPVARTVSRILGNINVMNNVENATANDYVCEYDSHMRLISSDINLSLLSRTIRNTNVDNCIANCIELIPDNRIDQTSRFNQEDTQHKQSTCGISASIEDRIGTRLYGSRAVRSTDLDLNVVKTNKNVEKALLNDITISTNRHVNDKEIGSDRTDDSLIVCLNKSSVTSNNCRSNDNYMCLNSASGTGLKIRDWNVARVPSVTFNERNIANKQIDAYDSKELLRCRVFHQNAVKSKIENNSKYKIDSCLKVSIDLRKIQNLIDSKPELFANPEYVDDRCTSSLNDEDYYAQ